MNSGWRSGDIRYLDGFGPMADAAIIHSHRNTDVTPAVILPLAQVIAKDVEVLVPAEGVSTLCAPPDVVVVPEQKGDIFRCRVAR